MPTEVTSYKCPACTGPLHFSAESGRLECEYCGTSYDAAEIEALYAGQEARAAEETKRAEESSFGTAENETPWDLTGLSDGWGADAEGMRTYSCPSCGAELICDASTAATSCPYCGNPSIVPGQFAGGLRPDYVLPFRLSRDDAVEALKKLYRGKPLLSRTFSSTNHLQEIKGVYVPFWMFDGHAEGESRFHTTRSRRYTSGEYRVTETDHFDVLRAGSIDFEKVPVDASSKMPDDYMDSIEPYDYSELKPFSTAYLPGFLADRYDVSAEDSFDRADARCRRTLVDSLAGTVSGYETCREEQSSVRLIRGRVHYALLPVWLLNTRWEGKDFLFAVNGQTGKAVGELPISKKRSALIFAAVAAPLIALGAAAVMWLVR